MAIHNPVTLMGKDASGNSEVIGVASNAAYVTLRDASGNAVTILSAMASGPIYEDANYKYFGSAVPGSALTSAVWQVTRMKISDSRIEFADGNANFDNVFTSLVVVAGLAYS